MSRVDAEEVKEIIDTTLSDSAIEAFITAANLTVTAKLGDVDELSTDQLKEIERWLTAHLIASSRERQIVRETTSDASATYEGKSDLGLNATLYGQQVMLLDTSGTLAISSKRFSSFHAVPQFEES